MYFILFLVKLFFIFLKRPGLFLLLTGEKLFFTFDRSRARNGVSYSGNLEVL